MFFHAVICLLLIAASDIAQRRGAVMERANDGLVLIHSSSALGWDAYSFRQEPSFYYFTGLANARNAILVIDGAAKDSSLCDAQSIVPFVSKRLAADPKLKLYVDSGGITGSVIGDAIENPYAAWKTFVHSQWPDAEIKDASPTLEDARAVKSKEEIALLRKAAQLTEPAFWAGVAAIRPGNSQRQVETAVVAKCLNADGPSFWPWVRSGAEAGPALMFEALSDYRNRNRTMKSGEVVRFDIGCESDLYKADYGRTIPVSGTFDEGQRETLDLLNRAYHAGVVAMRPGSTPQDVFRATNRYIIEHRGVLKTQLARDATATIKEDSSYYLHSLGLGIAEKPPDVFAPGNVVCYEPRLTSGDQSFFIEDTFLITKDGAELLSPKLPYAPSDIERAWKRHGTSRERSTKRP